LAFRSVSTSQVPSAHRVSKPILGRVSAVLVVVLMAAAIPRGALAVTRQQLNGAKATLHRLEHDIHDTRIRLHEVKREAHQSRVALRAFQARLNALAVKVTAAEAAYEDTRAQIEQTRIDLKAAKAEYAALRARIDQRARLLYEQGPGGNLELLFSATSLSDLTDRMEYVGAVNAQDISLAQQTQTVADGLKMKQNRLTVLRTREQKQLAALRSRQAVLNGEFAKQQSILNDLNAKESEARSLLSNLASRRTKISNLVSALGAALARQARLAALRAARAAQNVSIPSSGGGPVTLDHPFSYCPVAGPHAYSDSFGAPRNTTNPPHPHAGVDIFAPRNTPIVAPFSGSASEDPNGLGGNAVIVQGSAGYVYMAHLDHYGNMGSVSAGTVVGYVGNTGDAQGGATHDHFEWHPNVIPAHLWRSPYGYTDINGAIDPFPYLNQVC